MANGLGTGVLAFNAGSVSVNGNSVTGTPGRPGRPLPDCDWMIRVELDKAK